jgi:DNA-binding beta-propeller fold protein YncE
VAVDAATGTVYVANFGSAKKPGPSTVSVIDAGTCNATRTVGCADLGVLRVPGGNAYAIAVNPTTDTIYVGTLTDAGPDLLSVFDGAACNAVDTTGCGQVPATIKVGSSGGSFDDSVLNLAVNPATNTVYVTSITGITGDWTGAPVYMLNGAGCDATTTTGCGQAPKTIPTGSDPWGIAVDQASDTIYVVLEAAGDYAGSVAVINGATCNGSDSTGCLRAPPTVPAGFGADAVAIDPSTNMIYTANHQDASLSAINGATCNRLVSLGCSLTPPKLPAGTYPTPIAIDPAVATAYVASLWGVSVVPLNP